MANILACVLLQNQCLIGGGKVRKHSVFSSYYHLYYVSFNQLTTKAQGYDWNMASTAREDSSQHVI